MELPPIPFEIPQIDLPFAIPALIHPAVAHFIIAIPVLILLLELLNLFMGKKAIGGVNFFLLVLVVITSAGAYLTGLVDGKEASTLLTEGAKEELLEHKLLGTWLMLASVVVLLFKLLSVITQNGVIKTFYMIVLIGFTAGILKQGKEGGELVYEYGLNVDVVREMDDKIFELQDEIEDLKASLSTKAQEKSEVVIEEPAVEEETIVEEPTQVEIQELNETNTGEAS